MTTETQAPVALDTPSTQSAPEAKIYEDSLEFMLRGEPAPTPNRGVSVLEVGQIWGQTVLDVQHFAAGSPPVTLSGAVDATARRGSGGFYLPPDVLDVDGWPLLRWEADTLVVRICEGWRGFVDHGDQRRSLDALIRDGAARTAGTGVFDLTLGEHDSLTVEIGAFVFVARQVQAHRRVASPIRERMDYPLLSALAVVGFLSVMMLLVMLTTPLPANAATNEIDDHTIAILLEKPEDPPPVIAEKKTPPKEEEGAKPKGEEGKVGEKTAKMKIAKGDKVKLRKRELDQEVATSSGVLGAMRDGAAADVFSDTALSSALTGGIGGLIGAKGTQVGAGGLGGRGSGLGGGGKAEGLGGLGTSGRGGGKDNYGSGSGDWGTKKNGGDPNIPQDAFFFGSSLDKSLIDAVIKRNMNQIRHCYQRELTRDPSLGGKIVTKFTIAGNGTVSKSEIKSSSMGNEAVESCIAERIMHFQFPEPKGGGIVVVSYPFMFSQG